MNPGSNGAFVFLDRDGKRWPRLRRLILLLFCVAFLGFVLFTQSLLIASKLQLPSSIRLLHARMKALEEGANQYRPKTRNPLWLEFSRNRASRDNPFQGPTPPAKNNGVVLGFIDRWEPSSMGSLNAHADQLTHVAGEWMTIVDGLGAIVSKPDEQLAGLARARGLALLPILDNLIGDRRIPESVEGLANGPQSRQDRFIADLTGHLKKAGAVGVVIDWGLIDPTYNDTVTGLLERMAAGLHHQGFEVWLCVPMGLELNAFDLERLASSVDRFVAMLHDENSEIDSPGPIASQDWFEGWLEAMVEIGEPSQWIVGIGAYGYDWSADDKKAETVGFHDILSRAGRAGLSTCKSDPPTYNPHFSYEDEGTLHAVWFLDAATFMNQAGEALKRPVGGVAVYELGYEDPDIWKALRSMKTLTDGGAVPREFEVLEPRNTATNVGRGEFLTVDDSRFAGHRSFGSDETGRILESYDRFPSYLTLSHQGTTDRDEVAVTFDDGPDPRWTPKILDILKERGVKATFFVVGMKAESNPGILRRIVDEGHEIGVHTYTHPNIATISEDRAFLEFNATQRLIEIITGRSTILFRPPYKADSRPRDEEEIVPIKLAQRLGYITVAENIDPEDWGQPGADVIVDRVRLGRRAEGNIVLLHDAGGDRRQTVEALPRIIDYFMDRGDSIVSLSEMLDESRDYLMPPVREEGDRLAFLISGGGFRFLHAVEEFLWSFMIVATVLVVLRTLAVALLAYGHERNGRNPHGGPFTPPVTAVIAAYNEEKVIAATLEDLLASHYPGEIEVIVIDDGSMDRTSEVVSSIAVGDPRIRLIRQPNRGKAEALIQGIHAAGHDILVMLDADTRFEPHTITHLVRPLRDPRVAAVSGHARVGNLRTFIARCQALEYMCGFNLDRRAYDRLDCITVVPGAVSALRRSAVLEVGGINGDTLAEDTDLTLALHKRGFRIAYAPRAIAWTEAPETVASLARQRFRWAFGTLQCLWKHGDLLLATRKKALGWFSLPSIWLFQIILVAFGPLVDLLLLWSVLFGAGQAVLAYLIAFLVIDLFLAGLACTMEKEPVRKALLIIPMRFIYRPLLSWVICKSFIKAAQGAWVGWGKLERTASVPNRA